MNKLSFKKGNLFNGIDGKIDSNIIDSSQYDLEIKNGDTNLIAQFFYELPKFKSYGELLNSRYLSLIRPSRQENSELERELTRYFNGDQEDINYSFNNQGRVLRK